MNIGLVAHDSKKKLMQNFCIAYKGILAKNEYAYRSGYFLMHEIAWALGNQKEIMIKTQSQKIFPVDLIQLSLCTI